MHLVAYSFSQCLMPTVYDWFHYSPIFPILQGKSIDFIEFSLILTLFLPVFPFPVTGHRLYYFCPQQFSKQLGCT